MLCILDHLEFRAIRVLSSGLVVFLWFWFCVFVFYSSRAVAF